MGLLRAGNPKIFKMKYFIVLVIAAVGIAILSFTLRQYTGKRYAIQNVQTGKNLRPYAAGKQDGNRLVLYDHHSWKCMTWDFKEVGTETYQLQNRYTSKSFQASIKPESNAKLCQQPLTGSGLQEWEFIKQSDEAYLIKQNCTDLYLSISSEATNSDIVLMPLQSTKAQLWRLVKQNPLF